MGKLPIIFSLFSAVSCKPTQPRAVEVGGGAERRPGATQTPFPSVSDAPPQSTRRPAPSDDDDDFDPSHSETPTPSPTPTDEAPGNTHNTNGQGGIKGRVYNGRGQNGASYIAYAPNDNAPNQRSHGLLVLLHGSSRSSYDRFVNMMSQVATQHGLIPVSVLAPNGSGWNEGNQYNNAGYLDELIQNTIYRSYNIDTRNVIFSGQSSGAGFLSSHFIVGYGHKYRGGAFMQCGGARPVQRMNPSQEMLRGFRLHFEITQSDGIWEQSFYPAIQDYRGFGFQVTSDNSKPGGHCQFDQQQIIQQYVAAMISR